MNNIKMDLHIHSNHSCDSKTSIEEYCMAAIDHNVDIICITDHIDYNPHDDGYNFYDADKFFAEYNAVKSKYSDRVKLLCGIEFAEPHLYRDELAALSQYPYDFILGSMHFWYEDMFPSTMVKNNIPIRTCFDVYFDELFKSVEYGHYDSVAHFDFPVRYYKQGYYPMHTIDKILKTMISNGIALEINTSSLRKGLQVTMPSENIIDRYKSLGGRYITIGADTHSTKELAADYDTAVSIIKKHRLTPVYFENRKMIQLT